MKLRKCRKCKTIPILKSEMIYMPPPKRSNELIDPEEEFHFMLNIKPQELYYCECKCKSTMFYLTGGMALRAWKRKDTFEKTETRYDKILNELR